MICDGHLRKFDLNIEQFVSLSIFSLLHLAEGHSGWFLSLCLAVN